MGEVFFCIALKYFYRPFLLLHKSSFWFYVGGSVSRRRCRGGRVFAARESLAAGVPLRRRADAGVVAAAELADVDPTFQTLRNLNTPEEYEAALRDLQPI